MWPCSTWRIKIAARPLYHCPQQIHRSLSQCWRTEDLLGEGNRFKQRALFYSPTFKAAKLIVKSAGEREGVSLPFVPLSPSVQIYNALLQKCASKPYSISLSNSLWPDCEWVIRAGDKRIYRARNDSRQRSLRTLCAACVFIKKNITCPK